MTHITEARVIGNHADMGSDPAPARTPLTVWDILRAGAHRRANGGKTRTAQSTAGATADDESLSAPVKRRAPRGLRPPRGLGG